jgi:hypothetical protein
MYTYLIQMQQYLDVIPSPIMPSIAFSLPRSNVARHSGVVDISVP